MLRTALVLVSLSAAFVMAAPIPKTKVKDGEAIQGQWEIVELTHDGKPAVQQFQDTVIELDKDSFKVKIPNRDAAETMTYKLDADKKRIDLTPTGANVLAGLSIPGIYEIDGDTLTLAIAKATGGLRPAEIKGAPGVAFLKLRRIKEEKK